MKTYDELFALITQRGVHEVFGVYGEGYGIEQNAAELAEFLLHMQQLDVQSVLEVGTGYKAGLARFLYDDLDWRVTSVDIQSYGHQFGGIDFVHPRDFDHDAVDEAYDLVIIDADHSYEGVKDDHEFYAKYATKVIAFHDIAGLRECEGVEHYWYEISVNPGMDTYQKPGYHEIIADGDQRGGIGYAVLSEVAASTYKGFTHEIQPGWVEHPEEALKPPAKKPAPRKRTPVLPIIGTPEMFAAKHDSGKIADYLATKEQPAPRKRTPAKKATTPKK